MKLTVHTLGREVGTLESVGAFKSVMTYHPNPKTIIGQSEGLGTRRSHSKK